MASLYLALPGGRAFGCWLDRLASYGDLVGQWLRNEACAAEKALGKNSLLNVLIYIDDPAFKCAVTEKQEIRARADPDPGAGGKPGILDDCPHEKPR